MRFITTLVYHPNIDTAGRICHDALKMPPKVSEAMPICGVDGLISLTLIFIGFYFVCRGAWKPSLNIRTVLSSLRLLLSEANPDDGLMDDIVCGMCSSGVVFVVMLKGPYD